ncbi:uncharacterized protein LOC131847736 [Achroia grisella]|uniref:uncharacterized protein LOC131847736 n=1 Tax=Achroia grisella TaxID=688607 RepID=UPI0027D230A2|nr:uncharacterized protein LOC131847736 [Achroia grisella]
MTILVYDECELEERSSKTLKAWKAWHLILYSCAAVFGILNYVFLQNTMQLVNNSCVIYPRLLEFHMVPRDNLTTMKVETSNHTSNMSAAEQETTITTIAQPSETVHELNTSNAKIITKTEAQIIENADELETMIEVNNVTIVIGNRTHRLVLDTSRSLFGGETECEFAEYMPIMSTVFAAVWLTMFTMCPGGGRVRTGLPQPWRILTPALLFALVLVGLTGHSFTTTNGGLHAFCTAFHNVTNSTACSPVNDFLEDGWNATWGFGGRAAAARAASAGAWASWACAAALFLARCLAAPDFAVKHSEVYLVKDPQQKLTPYLRKSTRRSNRSNQTSPLKQDNMSVRSEPTITTELATVSMEPGQDSAPTSLLVTPVKKDPVRQNNEMIEMAYTPQERHE